MSKTFREKKVSLLRARTKKHFSSSLLVHPSASEINFRRAAAITQSFQFSQAASFSYPSPFQRGKARKKYCALARAFSYCERSLPVPISSRFETSTTKAERGACKMIQCRRNIRTSCKTRRNIASFFFLSLLCHEWIANPSCLERARATERKEKKGFYIKGPKMSVTFFSFSLGLSKENTVFVAAYVLANSFFFFRK